MELEIIRSDRRSFAIQIKQNKLIVRAPRRASDEEINALLRKNQKWIEKHAAKAQERQKALSACRKLTEDELQDLYARAKEVIPERVAYYAQLAGVSYNRITIRSQHTKWGSCSAKGNLNFNCLLMLAPTEVLDSVIVHELCHLKEMNHSDRFYAEVLRVFPEYRKWHGWLKDNGEALMARLP